MTTPFISTADLSDLLGEEVGGQDLATIALDSACEIVRGYLRQHINLVTDDEVRLDGLGTSSLLLPELPVRSVTSVTTFDADGNNETELVGNTDYIVGRAGILWRLSNYTWPRGHANVVVVYTHGWDLSETVQGSGSGASDEIERVPSDIRRVALELAKRLYQNASADAGLTSRTLGNYSETFATETANAGTLGVLGSEMAVLDRYALVR